MRDRQASLAQAFSQQERLWDLQFQRAEQCQVTKDHSRRSIQDDLPLRHDHHSLSKSCFLQQMSDLNKCQFLLLMQLMQEQGDFLAGERIEHRGGLISNNTAWA